MSRFKQLLRQLPPLQIALAQPLTEFTLFLKLPPEVRIMIWAYVAMVPRDVKVFVLEADRRSSRVEGQSLAPAIMHTSREARQEGKRYYELWREKCPLEGKNIFRDWLDRFDVEIRPSEPVRNARPNVNNKIWVNVVTDRFVFQSMKHVKHKLLYSPEDYNYCSDDLLKIRHFRGELHFRGGHLKERTEWALLTAIGFESLTCFLSSWRGSRTHPHGTSHKAEDPMAARLWFKAYAENSSKLYHSTQTTINMHHQRTIKFELEEDRDLAPCKARPLKRQTRPRTFDNDEVRYDRYFLTPEPL